MKDTPAPLVDQLGQSRGPELGPSRTRLRILFVCKNYLPHVGGSEISTHHLAAALSERGHIVTVLTRLSPRSFVGMLDLVVSTTVGRCPRRRDGSRWGYPVIRTSCPVEGLPPTLRSFGPDVVVVTCGDPGFAAHALHRTSAYPTILYLRDAESVDAARAGAHTDAIVANSNFVRGLAMAIGKEAHFLPSLFPREHYQVRTTRKHVLFVNPTPKKGLGVALQVAAARPDIPFVYRLSWRLPRRAIRRVASAASRLRNVRIAKRTLDPTELFGECRFVIAPSQTLESWCRVVTEAQISGIPAIASRIGGLPEAVGPAGLLVDPPDSGDAWVAAVSRLWDDHDLYWRLARASVEYSRRPELSPAYILDRFETLVQQAVRKHQRAKVIAIRPAAPT